MNHQAEKMKLFSVYRVEKKNLVIHLSQFLEFVKGPPPLPHLIKECKEQGSALLEGMNGVWVCGWEWVGSG